MRRQGKRRHGIGAFEEEGWDDCCECLSFQLYCSDGGGRQKKQPKLSVPAGVYIVAATARVLFQIWTGVCLK